MHPVGGRTVIEGSSTGEPQPILRWFSSFDATVSRQVVPALTPSPAFAKYVCSGGAGSCCRAVCSARARGEGNAIRSRTTTRSGVGRESPIALQSKWVPVAVLISDPVVAFVVVSAPEAEQPAARITQTKPDVAALMRSPCPSTRWDGNAGAAPSISSSSPPATRHVRKAPHADCARRKMSDEGVHAWVRSEGRTADSTCPSTDGACLY
jgi:hypothetical protein